MKRLLVLFCCLLVFTAHARWTTTARFWGVNVDYQQLAQGYVGLGISGGKYLTNKIFSENYALCYEFNTNKGSKGVYFDYDFRYSWMMAGLNVNSCFYSKPPKDSPKITGGSPDIGFRLKLGVSVHQVVTVSYGYNLMINDNPNIAGMKGHVIAVELCVPLKYNSTPGNRMIFGLFDFEKYL